MKTRIMVGIFLVCGEKVLLLHRNMNRKIAPGMWSCVGGHMEQCELNNPLETCYRELEEETGITEEQVQDIELRYVSMAVRDDEVQTIYYYIGNIASECELPPCDEGNLYWVHVADMCNLEMSFSVRQITNHWYSNLKDKSLYICVTNREEKRATFVRL